MSSFQTVFADSTIIPGYAGKIILSERDIVSNSFTLTNNADNVWNTIDLSASDAGLWLFGGSNVGVYSYTHNSTFTTFHADHNAIGSVNIQTAPSGGSLTAQHVTSNNPNGYILSQGMRPYIITGSTTINFVIQPSWDFGTCVAYGVAMGIKLA